MAYLADLFGGGQVLGLSADLTLREKSPRVTVITSNSSHVVNLPPTTSILNSGLNFLIVNKSGASLTVQSITDSYSVNLANNASGFFALADKCDGSGKEWFGAGRTVADTHTAVIQSGRSTICIAEDSPPAPPAPPGNCLVLAYNTGQETTAGGSCDTDNHWTIDSNPAKITDKIVTWVDPPKGSKWIASLCDTSGADENGTTHDYTTTIRLLDSTVTRVQGLIAVDNYLTDILVNGNSTGIQVTHGGPFNLNSFELTRGDGLVAGDNTIVFKTKQDDKGSNNPFGLLVQWINICDRASYSPYAQDCQYYAYNTGQKQSAFTPCNKDDAWIGEGSPAVITAKRPQWITPPEDSAWISIICDSYVADAANTIRTFSTKVTVPNDDVPSIKGVFAVDNHLTALRINGTPTGIAYTTDKGYFSTLQQFEITRGMGLITGENLVEFETRNRGFAAGEGTDGVDPNPYGILVAWQNACPPQFSCDAASLAGCPITKTVTISGGTGAFAPFNGVWTVTKAVGTNYWRFLIDAVNYIDLLCVTGDFTHHWQGFINGGSEIVKRFGRNDNVGCPPNGTYDCFVSEAESTDCLMPVVFVVSD